MDNSIIIIRSHYYNETIEGFFRDLESQSKIKVVLAVDETAGKKVDTGKCDKISINEYSINDIHLPYFESIPWLCGDYCFYLAKKQFPHADTFWLFDHDARINSANYEEFFSLFQDKTEADFLTTYYKKSDESWYWHNRMSPFYKNVYRCFFPVTRLSSIAIDFLSGRRASFLGRAISSGITDIVYPNDEVFVATELSNNGFTCMDLNGFGKILYNDQTFTYEKPISIKSYNKKNTDNMLYHPVLGGVDYAKKVIRSVNESHNLHAPLITLNEILQYENYILEECGEQVADIFRRHVAELGKRATNL